MQLSSALLTATALLAHAVSGFYLSAETAEPGFPPSSFATVRDDTVGFYDDGAGAERAIIDVRDQRIVNGFGLEQQDHSELFIFKSDIRGAEVCLPLPLVYHCRYRAFGILLTCLGLDPFGAVFLDRRGQVQMAAGAGGGYQVAPLWSYRRPGPLPRPQRRSSR